MNAHEIIIKLPKGLWKLWEICDLLRAMIQQLYDMYTTYYNSYRILIGLHLVTTVVVLISKTGVFMFKISKLLYI